MLKNPLSVDNDIDTLVAELSHEGSDAKTVAKLYSKIMAKGLAAGFLVSAGIGVAILGVAAIVSAASETPEEETI